MRKTTALTFEKMIQQPPPQYAPAPAYAQQVNILKSQRATQFAMYNGDDADF